MSANKPLAEYLKDPVATIDFSVDWSGILPAGDNISSAIATAESGLTVASHSFSGQLHTIWLTGGTAGTTYLVTSEVTSAAGRRDRRTIRITVVER